MKKMTKAFVLMMTLFLALSVVPSQVFGQELDLVNILNEIQAANMDIESAEGDIKGAIYAEVDGVPYLDLNVSGPFMFNVEPRFALEAEMAVEGSVSETDAEGEVQTEEIAEQATLVFLEGMLYAFNGSEWTTKDLQKEEEEFIKSYEEAKAQEEKIDKAALNEKMLAYYDVEDTGDTYIIKLKEDIDSEAFWTDVNEVVDIEAIKEEAMQQAQDQAEEQGVEFTEAQRNQVEYYFNNVLNLFIDLIDNVEIHYTKEDYKLTKMVVDLSATEVEVGKVIGMDPEALGITGKAKINYEINLSNHGGEFDIQKPADAPEAEEEDTMMEEDQMEEEMEESESSEN